MDRPFVAQRTVSKHSNCGELNLVR